MTKLAISVRIKFVGEKKWSHSTQSITLPLIQSNPCKFLKSPVSQQGHWVGSPAFAASLELKHVEDCDNLFNINNLLVPTLGTDTRCCATQGEYCSMGGTASSKQTGHSSSLFLSAIWTSSSSSFLWLYPVALGRSAICSSAILICSRAFCR